MQSAVRSKWSRSRDSHLIRSGAAGHVWVLRHPTIEAGTELGGERTPDLVDLDSAELIGERRHHPRFEAARIDAREVAEIGRHVECEAVKRDPLAAGDPDRAQLAPRVG